MSFWTIGSFSALAFICLFIPSAFCSESRQGTVVHPRAYQPATASNASEAGKILLEQHNCLTCHSIGNRGGCLSPPFDGIGAYRSPKFILARITRGAENQFENLYGQAELMPHIRLPAKEAKLVSQYLLTLPAPRGGFYVGSHGDIPDDNQNTEKENPKPEQLSEKRIASGKILFCEHGCTACHSIDNIGGHLGPNLDTIGKNHNEEYIERHINNIELFSQNSDDEYQKHGIVMPPFGLSNDEIQSISQFLMSLH